MPIFPNANHVDANGCVFNDIAGDQILQFYTVFTGLNPDQIVDSESVERLQNRVAHPAADAVWSPLSSREDLIQRRSHILTYLSNAAGGPGDVLTLINEIKSLIGRGGPSSCSYVALELELDLLHQTLVFTSLGIKSFQWTLLGQSLAKVINLELVRCVEVLRCLREAITNFRDGLWLTSIWSLWRLVWSSTFGVDELVLWRRKLFDCRRSLGMIVMAMYS